ncbi:MAG: RNase P modulator RnpM [Christensenellales bacterium]
MLNKKVPLRMCVACKTSKPKKELIRIVKTDNDVVLDKTGKMNGRGTYICNNCECLNKLIKQKILNKVYKTNISQDVYEKLKEQFVENGKN